MKNKNCDLIYKDECYRIIGFCYEIYNNLGFGLKEKNYQSALEKVLEREKVGFRSQFYIPLRYEEKLIGKFFIDLLVDDKIAIELKVGDHFLTKDIKQLLAYLKSKKLKLGLLVNFTSNGVRYKRIINLA